jgi:hypothetical protein
MKLKDTKNPFICLQVRYSFVILGKFSDIVTNHPLSQYGVQYFLDCKTQPNYLGVKISRKEIYTY